MNMFKLAIIRNNAENNKLNLRMICVINIDFAEINRYI